MLMEERNIRDLSEKQSIEMRDQFLIETLDGTRLIGAENVKKLLTNNIVFNTLEDMKNSVLSEGDICITLGYNKINDGGAGIYRIVYEPTAVEDGGLLHYLRTSDTLRAKFLQRGDCVTPEQFGAVGDGSKSDSIAIEKAFASGFKVRFFPNKTYKINRMIELSSDTIYDFNGCTIKPYGCDAIGIASTNSKIDRLYNVTIENVKIDMVNASTYQAIYIGKPSTNLIINNITVNDIIRTPVRIKMICDGLNISNCRFNCSNVVSICIEFYDGAQPPQRIHIHDITFYNFEIGIKIGGSNDYSMITVDNCNLIMDSVRSETCLVYNNSYGKRTISILNAIMKNIEYLIVNTGSADIALRDSMLITSNSSARNKYKSTPMNTVVSDTNNVIRYIG